jgi:hypothetical protein
MMNTLSLAVKTILEFLGLLVAEIVALVFKLLGSYFERRLRLDLDLT